MSTTVKDIDGGRSMTIKATGASVFLWGKGFSYEFDRGIFNRAYQREMDQCVQNAQDFPPRPALALA